MSKQPYPPQWLPAESAPAREPTLAETREKLVELAHEVVRAGDRLKHARFLVGAEGEQAEKEKQTARLQLFEKQHADLCTRHGPENVRSLDRFFEYEVKDFDEELTRASEQAARESEAIDEEQHERPEEHPNAPPRDGLDMPSEDDLSELETESTIEGEPPKQSKKRRK